MSATARRRFLTGAGALFAAFPALGQKAAGRAARVGFLGASTPAAWKPRVDAFRAGLRELGYVEGKDVVIEFRFAENQYQRLPALAAELVDLKVDVIVTHAAPGALAAKQATAANRIPVVMTNVGDAVGWGIVENLARPGGNITGDTFFITELVAKRLEVLKEALPGVRRVGVLANPDNARAGQSVQAMESAARELGLTLVRFDARGGGDLERAFGAMMKEKIDALAVVEDVALISNGPRIVELALTRRLPSISTVEYAEAGGLLGYGVDFLALYRRAAVFVDKILKGVRPGDIPVERPARFEFVINMKTAKALGVAIAPATRLRADREIP